MSVDYRAGTWHVHTHGAGGYSRGCRCDICKAGKAAYMRDKRAAAAVRRREAQARGETYVASGVYHGTAASYRDASCRCERCVEAVKVFEARTFDRMARAVAS